MPSAVPSTLYAIPRNPVRTTDTATDESHANRTVHADDSSKNRISGRGAGLVISCVCPACQAPVGTREDPQQCAARFGHPTARERDGGVHWMSPERDESSRVP